MGRQIKMGASPKSIGKKIYREIATPIKQD
jgi:hypothetical protein